MEFPSGPSGEAAPEIPGAQSRKTPGDILTSVSRKSGEVLEDESEVIGCELIDHRAREIVQSRANPMSFSPAFPPQ